MGTQLAAETAVQQEFALLNRQADALMLGGLGLGAVVAIAIGATGDGLALALMVALPLLLLGGAVFATMRGTSASRYVMCVTTVAMVALHIQLGHGTLEYHFGVFALLALNLGYRDWRPIVFTAGLFAVHHVLFDRLQLANTGVYCLTTPSFERVLIHAGYVVVQSALEIGLALQMKTDALQSAELKALTRHVVRGETLDLDVSRIRTTTPVAVQLRQTLDRVALAMKDISDAASHMNVSGGEIASGSQDLSVRTEHTASSLQQAASSMEELTAAVKQSAASAHQANQLASSAAEVAARGGSVVSQVVTTMDEINASSKKISDIIGVIDGIAFQTNILALNAAVEAARAGEQGRGFAVVASEVRSLAGRSAEAAKEIKGLIGASVDRVEAGSRLVADAGATMTEIVGSVQRVADIVGEITAASSEQSTGIGQVNTAVAQLDQMTQQNAALVEESAAAAEGLKAQAARLTRVVSAFDLGETGRQAAATAAAPTKSHARPAAVRKPVAKPASVAAHPSPAPKAPVAAPRPAPASAPKPMATTAHNDDWETF